MRLRQLPIEALARTTFIRSPGNGIKPEFGIETAYNQLDSQFSLTVDNGSGPRPVALPAADVLVKEWRGEAFANLAWEVTRSLTLEGAIALEASQITVSGDAQSRQSFVFLKPAGAVVYRMTPWTQIRFGVRRSVGQLDFSDFAASAELQDDETVAGNPALRPDLATRLSVSVDHRTEGGFALAFEAYREWRSDVLEQVLLPSGAPGLGNAGSATVTGIKGSVNAPLDGFLPGASLKIDAEVRGSRFIDPLIGDARDLNDLRSPIISGEFRHNLVGAPWSWGLTYQAGSNATIFLVDQTDANKHGARIGGFVETTALRGLRARLSVRSAATERYSRLRTFYSPDRAGRISGTDQRESGRGAFVNLTLSGSL